MKTITILKPGGYSKLNIEERSAPVLRNSTDVLIDVSHSGVNYADCLTRLGLYKSARALAKYPLVPGFDFSGTVKKIGDGVTTVKVGDRVFGITLFGGYQSELVVSQEYLVLLPTKMSFGVAASIPTAYLTAFHILRNLAHLKEKDRVFIRSIGGGVGQWLSILANREGSQVYGTVSTDPKKQKLEKMGFKHASLAGEKEYEVKGYDVIANALGGSSIRRDLRQLRSGGRLILYGFHGMVSTDENGKLTTMSWVKIIFNILALPRISPFLLVNQNKSVMGCNLSYLFSEVSSYRKAMDELMALLRDEDIVLPQITEISYENVKEAHYLLEHGKTLGKLVLRFDDI